MSFDYVERVIRDGEDDLEVINEFTENGYTIHLTTMHADRSTKSITFRKASQ